MAQAVVGTVRAWLETVADYPGKPENGNTRTLADGLTTTERLILMILADFEQQQGGAHPSQARVGLAAGRSRRQTIRIMETLRGLDLLAIVKPAMQQRPAVYRVTIPGVPPSVTPATNPDVTLAASRCDITSTQQCHPDVTQTYGTSTNKERAPHSRSRTHQKHAVCGRRLCLTEYQCQQFVGGLGGHPETARATVTAWAQRLFARLDGGDLENTIISGNPLTFLDRQWEERAREEEQRAIRERANRQFEKTQERLREIEAFDPKRKPVKVSA